MSNSSTDERSALIACLEWQCEAGHDSWSKQLTPSDLPPAGSTDGWMGASKATHTLLNNLTRRPVEHSTSHRDVEQHKQELEREFNISHNTSANTRSAAKNRLNAGAKDTKSSTPASTIKRNERTIIAPADALAQAEQLALACENLERLEEAVLSCNLCPLRIGARNGVFAEGEPKSGLMIVGEAPGKEEDEQGKPFVGASGKLLMRMLSHIGITSREQYYITNLVYWRPPGNRPPNSDELLVCHPFFKRQVALVQPRLLLLLGNVATQTILREKSGITRLRGKFLEYNLDHAYEKIRSTNDTSGGKFGTPFRRTVQTLATFHPSYLLRTPVKKSAAWHDLLMLRQALQGSIMPQA